MLIECLFGVVSFQVVRERCQKLLVSSPVCTICLIVSLSAVEYMDSKYQWVGIFRRKSTLMG